MPQHKIKILKKLQSRNRSVVAKDLGGRHVSKGTDVRGLWGWGGSWICPVSKLWLWIQDSGHLSKFKKTDTPKSEFYYMQIDWWIFICQFLLLRARNPFISFPSCTILHSVASPLQPFPGMLLPPHSLPIKKEKHSKKDKTEFPKWKF